MSGEFSNNPDRLLGTGEQLSAHIDEWAASLDEHDRHTQKFGIAMGKKLADRIGGGVVPMGYVMATELLTHDCQEGIDGFTGEPLPTSIAGYPPVMYGMFRMQAEQFAKGAFGEEFGDQVSQTYTAIFARSQQPEA
jgi:hypothetical protein